MNKKICAVILLLIFGILVVLLINCTPASVTTNKNAWMAFYSIDKFEHNHHSYLQFLGKSGGNFSIVHDPDCTCYKN